MNDAKLLKEFLFSEYDTKIYLALAHLHDGKVGEIAKESGVPHNKVYECLTRLARRGYIAELGVSPKEYKILGLGQFKEELERKERDINEIKRGLRHLAKNIAENRTFSQSIATVFRGKDKVIQMHDELSPKIKEYQYSLVGGLIFTYKRVLSIKDSIKRGVDHRFLAHYDHTREKDYQRWKDIGVRLRFYPNDEQKSIRFSTSDGKWCRITIGKPQIPNPDNYLTFWIESPAFALLLKDMFLDLWDKSVEKI